MAQASRTRRRRKTTRLGILAALLSTASALSLNDLQPIQDGVLPVACSLVYHATIQGCTAADFTSAQRCSSACRNGIRSIEDDVSDSCDTVNPMPNSVLDFAQKGILIIEACFLNAVTLATTSTASTTLQKTSTSLPPVIITTSAAKTSQSVGFFTTIPSPPISTTALTTSLTFVPPPLTSTTTSRRSTSVLATTPLPPAATTSSAFSSTTASTSPSADGGSGRGGGSPFDATSSSSRASASWSLYLPACAGLATLILLQ